MGGGRRRRRPGSLACDRASDRIGRHVGGGGRRRSPRRMDDSDVAGSAPGCRRPFRVKPGSVSESRQRRRGLRKYTYYCTCTLILLLYLSRLFQYVVGMCAYSSVFGCGIQLCCVWTNEQQLRDIEKNVKGKALFIFVRIRAYLSCLAAFSCVIAQKILPTEDPAAGPEETLEWPPNGVMSCMRQVFGQNEIVLHLYAEIW